MGKRKLQEDDDEPMLLIRLADEAGEPPLHAQHFLLQTFSKLCRRLPADSDVWDLSNLLVDGQPVPRETVVAWLNKAHRTAYGEGEFQQQEPDPCQTFTGLCQLLAFADAVDSTKALLNTCVAQLDGLQLHAQLGEQRLQLESDGRPYKFVDPGPRLQLVAGELTTAHNVGEPAANEAEVEAFKAQAAAQTEQLLFMAIKLQLAPLVERLHAFVASSFAFSSSIFTGREQAVFSERVLDAAVGDNKLGRQAWVDSITQQRCGLVAKSTVPSWSQLLQPLDLTEQQKQPLQFKAMLTRDFLRTPKGAVVDVKLDLFGKSWITVGCRTFLLHPMMG